MAFRASTSHPLSGFLLVVREVLDAQVVEEEHAVAQGNGALVVLLLDCRLHLALEQVGLP